MKFPRTLDQAFGPYTSHEFVDTNEPKGWWAAMVVIAIVSAVIVWVYP